MKNKSDDSYPRIEPEVWQVIESLRGTDSRATLAWIYRFARRSQGLIVLNQPSIKEAAAAVLGSLDSSSNCGSPRVYLVDYRRAELMKLFQELSRKSFAEAVTLYHGSLGEFFRDLPLLPELIAIGSASSRLSVPDLRATLPARTPVLCPDTATESEGAGLRRLVEHGILELEESPQGGPVFRATHLCHGSGFVPGSHQRMILQGLLHERYILSAGPVDSDHTPISDLAEDICREFSRQFPPARASGSWPYAAPESPGLPPALPSGKPWPKISIVTPTRNQGQYIEETILSVLNQGYPNVEHIVVDGASTDGTQSVLERYRGRLALVISEPDSGQSDAINKGLSKATGDILTWLNSDDMLASGALAAVALALDTEEADMIAGVCLRHRDGRLIGRHLTCCDDGPLPLEDLLDLDFGWSDGQFFHQPEVMFTRDLWLRAKGHLNEDLLYSMDYELWLRFARAGAKLHVIGRPLAWFRVHEAQKTYATSSFLPELRACRDAFIKENGLAIRPATSTAPLRTKLQITLLNDHGGFHGAGIAHVRLARALAWAGHDISIVSMVGTPAEGHSPSKYTTASVLDRVSASKPDLVMVGNLHNASADPLLLNRLSERFPTLVVMHDFWVLTGRCAYTGSCEKYLTGCDESCPTPNEYPALPPAEIADAWLKKRLLLGAPARPMLLANSEWTAAFARRALPAASFPEGHPPSVETIQLSFPLDVLRPRDQRDCREQLGLPLDRFLILLPASLEDPRKGVRPLLDALARFEIPNLAAVTIGSPVRSVECPIEVIQLGYIHDPRRVAMLNSAVDVVVAPSLAETFGQVYIEAAACGTVVAGYPVAAVPEAIRAGVTGLLASEANPTSLAAAIHHLYVHPELRNDLARWGRMYVENEWSEFSAYRHFFLALRRLGLASSLNLKRQIEFLPSAPPVPPLQKVWQSPSAWQPLQGFSAIESAPSLGLPSFRWAYGPVALAEVRASVPGTYNILIVYRNPHEGQHLKLRLNGALIGSYELPFTGYQSGRVLVQKAILDCEPNVLHFEYSHWSSDKENARPLALMVVEILVEQIAEQDDIAKLPTSQQGLVAAWGGAD